MKYPDDYINKIICGDCLEVMKGIPSGAVDLVLTDPPYGWGQDIKGRNVCGTTEWNVRPDDEVFRELNRISSKQIIWGGNYFDLPRTRCFFVWDKKQPIRQFARCEYAWTNLGQNADIFEYPCYGNINREENRCHPTQKPVALMAWCLNKIPDAQLIIDPFLGSGTTAIACKKLNRNFIGVELNSDYCKIAQERLNGIPESLFKEGR